MKENKKLTFVAQTLKGVEILYGLWNAIMFVLVVFTVAFDRSTLESFTNGPLTIGKELAIPLSAPVAFLAFSVSLSGYVMLRYLNVFMKNVSEGRLFVDENAKAMKMVGYTLVAFVLLNDTITYLFSKQILPYLHALHVQASSNFDISWTFLIASIPFFVLGYLLKIANQAVEENEQTI